jgi:DNA repair photolyase
MKAISESALWKKRLGDWVVNPYIGCEHGCLHCYCPAMPGVKFFNQGHAQEDWGKYIFPKGAAPHGRDFVDALRQQLRTFTPDKAKRTEWGDGWVLMSFLTDCYTPIEAKLKITRQCLQLLLEAGHKVRLQTRSGMVERDFDILSAYRDRVLLGTSLPYLDDELTRVLEPRAPAPTRRLQMLGKAMRAGIPTYVAVAPVMPFTSWVDIASLFNSLGAMTPLREIFCEGLNPKGSNLEMMKKALWEATQAGERDFSREIVALSLYNERKWAVRTAAVLKLGTRLVGERFIPWPDTQRRWAKHLLNYQVEWLDRYLPGKTQPAMEKQMIAA